MGSSTGQLLVTIVGAFILWACGRFYSLINKMFSKKEKKDELYRKKIDCLIYAIEKQPSDICQIIKTDFERKLKSELSEEDYIDNIQ